MRQRQTETISASFVRRNGGPDVCLRCGGNIIKQKWRGEGSCLQCGCWYYGNGHHSPVALMNTLPMTGWGNNAYLPELFPAPDLPSWVNDSPIFNSLVLHFDRCAASNGGCSCCIVQHLCQALFEEACDIAEMQRFSLTHFRLFVTRLQKLSK